MKLHIVPARTGLLWVLQGVRTFMRQPLAISGLFLMFMGLVSVLSAIPVFGSALALALVPAVTLGLMAASREAQTGRFPMPLVLLTAFREGPQSRRDMLILGALYAVCMLVLMWIGTLLMGEAPVSTVADETAVSPMRQAFSNRSIGWLLVCYLPVMAAFWHAPALVHWHGVSPGKSMFFSLMACWANKGAMLLFMLGWMGVFAATGLLLSLLIGVLGRDSSVLPMLLYPLVLLMAAMFHASLWFSFRDSFTDTPPTVEDSARLN